MLRMDQVHVVRHKVLVKGLAIRRVAREMLAYRQVGRSAGIRCASTSKSPCRSSGKKAW